MKGAVQVNHETLFDPLFDTPAGAAAVLESDKTVFSQCIGAANVEHAVQVGPHTVFPISSMTKQFTGLITAQLMQEGEFSPATRVQELLPELTAYPDTITVDQLLHHTSGLPDPYEHFAQEGGRTYGITNAVVLGDFLASTPLDFPPGTDFHYSNTNYIALATIAERTVGDTFGQLLQRRLFERAGMGDSRLVVDRRVQPGRAYGYALNDGSLRTVEHGWLTYGDGGILASLRDLSMRGGWRYSLTFFRDDEAVLMLMDDTLRIGRRQYRVFVNSVLTSSHCSTR